MRLAEKDVLYTIVLTDDELLDVIAALKTKEETYRQEKMDSFAASAADLVKQLTLFRATSPSN